MNKNDIEKVLSSIESIRENIFESSKIPLIFQSIERMDKQITEINVKLDSKFLTKEQFVPIKMIVYGGVSLALTAFGVAIISNIIK